MGNCSRTCPMNCWSRSRGRRRHPSRSWWWSCWWPWVTGGTFAEAAQAVGRPADEGIDDVINEDRLGLDVIDLQTKKWEALVSRPEIQKFVGALHGRHARKGVFITTSGFTREARDYAAGIDNKVVLVDGQRLVSLMIEHNAGVSIERTYHVKKVDHDYFADE